MRVLILGGTAFIGRHIAEVLGGRGYTVTLLNRGQTADDLSIPGERLRGDRNEGAAGLAALGDRSWDACVDVSGYTPRQVRPSSELLQDRVKRYVYVSTVSVYPDSDIRPVRETHARFAPAAEDVTDVNADTYGPLKVTCEDIVQATYGDRCAILRPQIVAGPHDPTGRYSYWVHRAGQGGEMLAPGDGSDHVQVIDVRDLARFARDVIEKSLSGPFNMAGPRLTWAEFLQLVGAEDLAWVPDEVLEKAGVTFREMPLYRRDGAKWSSLMDVSAERAREAGLGWTDPGVTVADTRAWLRSETLTPMLTPEREAELIRLARSLDGS